MSLNCSLKIKALWDNFLILQVSNVPFPFTSVSDWEASIRAPVGAAFLPPSAFKKMIQPKVKTQMGAVIEPMDKTQLVKRGIKVKGTENL